MFLLALLWSCSDGKNSTSGTSGPSDGNGDADTDADTDADADADVDGDTDADTDSDLAPCALPLDTVAVADCAAGGYGALIDGYGYVSIQAAIDDAGPFATITVCPGVWPGGLKLDEGQVLAGADPTPGAVVIDGQGTEQVVQTSGDATVTGLTLRNGYDTTLPGAGLYATGNARVECVVIEDCHGRAGGGMFAAGDLMLMTSAFLRNTGEFWGGALATGSWAASIVIEDTSFVDNVSPTIYGGAIFGGPASLVIRRSEFVGNAAPEGSAIQFGGTIESADVHIEDTLFEANDTTSIGSAVEFTSVSDPNAARLFRFSMVGTTFTANTSAGGASAMTVDTLDSALVDITDTTFAGNIGALGALSLQGANTALRMDLTTFTDNVGSEGAGAFEASRGDPVAIVGTDLTVLRNSGTDGAVSLRLGDTFACTTCDFGIDVDDNTPVDLTHDGVTTDDLPDTFAL